MAIPFLLFWIILFIAREELGGKGIGICVAIWAGLLAGCVFDVFSPYVFVALQALFDAILVLVAFGGDIQIR